MRLNVLWVALLAAGCDRAPTTLTQTTTTTTTTPPEGDPVRVLVWNVESLGNTGSAENDAVRSILLRFDPDVVALNEIDWDERNDLADLADDLGYDTIVEPDSNPFGELHNALLTRLPVRSSEIWTSAALSGDDAANDLTRLPVSIEVESGAATLTIVTQHWKSGYETADAFRRTVDSIRTGQAAERAVGTNVVVVGDVNAELDDPDTSAFTAVPNGMPSEYVLGDDLRGDLGNGIDSNVFQPLWDAGLTVVDALQMDGRTGTRDESGRRLDHAFIGSGVRLLGSEVYDARDEGMSGLDKPGNEPARTATAEASDHFPVVIDVVP